MRENYGIRENLRRMTDEARRGLIGAIMKELSEKERDEINNILNGQPKSKYLCRGRHLRIALIDDSESDEATSAKLCYLAKKYPDKFRQHYSRFVRRSEEKNEN